MREYYTIDEIMYLEKHLSGLRGHLLMDDTGSISLFKNYHTVSKEITRGGFLWIKKTTETVFYLESLTFINDDGEEYVHRRGHGLCSPEGLEDVMRYRLNYSEFQKKMIKFVTKTGIPISFVPYQTESSLED